MLPNIPYAIWKATVGHLQYVQCLNIASIEKTWFMDPVEYSPNGRGIMVPMEYNLMVYSPYGKSIFYGRLFSQVVIVIEKDFKNTVYKR